MTANATCRTCGRKFHACTFCVFLYDWEHDYCSEKCYAMSEQEEPRKPSIRELAEKHGIDLSNVKGEDIDVITGKRVCDE